MNELIDKSILSSRYNLYRFTKRILAKYGVRLKKKLSQNISIDPGYLRVLSKEALSSSPNVVLEVGTGIGFLTAALAFESNSTLVVSIEKDPKLYAIASRVLAHLENVSLVRADALDYLYRANIEVAASSLPFNITSQVLLSIARNNTIRKAVLGIQREVCRRMKASPGETDYGRLSVIIQLLFNVKELSTYPPESFYPSPKVFISVVELVRKKEYDEEKHRRLERLTACLFSQKNKLAAKVLRKCIGEPEEELLRRLEKKRVRDLTPGEIEEIVERAEGLRNTG